VPAFVPDVAAFNGICEGDSVYACHHRLGCRDDSTYKDSCDHESSEQCSHIASQTVIALTHKRAVSATRSIPSSPNPPPSA
jgi:hypothetical protein